MLAIYLATIAVVTVSLPANTVANNTMTKNLKVLVSSNDFPPAALKLLQEQ